MFVSVKQVLAFQKSWRSFSPITVLLHNDSARPGGGGGGGGGAGVTCPHPLRRGRGECPIFFSHIYMYGNVLVVFGSFWGGLGYFEAVGFDEAVGFEKRNLAHYMYGDGLVVFGVFLVGLGYFEAVGFQKRNLAHYMYGDALVGFGMVLGGLGCFNGPHDGYANRSNSKTSLPRAKGSPTDSRTVLPRAIG